MVDERPHGRLVRLTFFDPFEAEIRRNEPAARVIYIEPDVAGAEPS